MLTACSSDLTACSIWPLAKIALPLITESSTHRMPTVAACPAHWSSCLCLWHLSPSSVLCPLVVPNSKSSEGGRCHCCSGGLAPGKEHEFTHEHFRFAATCDQQPFCQNAMCSFAYMQKAVLMLFACVCAACLIITKATRQWNEGNALNLLYLALVASQEPRVLPL